MYYLIKFDDVIYKVAFQLFQKLHLQIYPTNSWHHELIHFCLSFRIWKVWKGRKKLQKFEYLENEKSFFDEIKNIFHSFWWKNKNLMKNSGHKL